METIQSIKIPAHYNIYTGANDRDLRIDFVIPTQGVNENTGLFILVPGFGASIESKVYKKMLINFADLYNVVTLQCDYFGHRFMQGGENLILKTPFSEIAHLFLEEEMQQIKDEPQRLLSILSTKQVNVYAQENLDESLDEFADLSYMQAIDIITAIEAVKVLLKGNKLTFNEKRVIGWGQSQGAYLLHLVNRLTPHLLSLIIDNAAWIQPSYLNDKRVLAMKINNCTFNVSFEYLVSKLAIDQEALSLKTLYKEFENNSYIKSFIGTTDNLVSEKEKEEIFRFVPYCDFHIIDETKVDGEIFKSTNHGLDADFIKLVGYIMSEDIYHINKKEKESNYQVKLSQTVITVDYTNELPIFNFKW
ncbi:DUF2920 family protein [Lysinibacillus sp. NPDC097231]|uniref:DUF2920 family protein n=1 Tax=Lysinibacillus sp. NPDC097231 TaxID=3364142 RepID=UPI0038228596